VDSKNKEILLAQNIEFNLMAQKQSDKIATEIKKIDLLWTKLEDPADWWKNND
jgi:hypothetical protein